MAIRPSGAIRRQLRALFNLGAIGELTDGQLLERFATQDAEAAELAFAALVERHGPMVLRVCRNTLRDSNDVQDAFQATFLALVQKARSLWVRDSLGPWLHRVAHRVATRARSSAARWREHERRAAATRPTLVSERGDWDDLMALLHEEIDRLPERYRVPVVLCDLQGLTHERAARHLGWPVGTVKSRLARARELLRGRLSRRGLGLPAGLMIAEKGLGGAFRAVEDVLPSTLVESTVRAAVPFAAGKALAVGVISSHVAILIEEVLKTMFLTKLKLASMVALLIGAAGAAGVLAQPGPGSDASPAADRPQGPAARAPAPAYITQSRAMIITRLEEEVGEARARLDRSLWKVRSPDDPAVVRARRTFEDLQQRLDRIDRVLVDVVETYPTMFDFSGQPGQTQPSQAQQGQQAQQGKQGKQAQQGQQSQGQPGQGQPGRDQQGQGQTGQQGQGQKGQGQTGQQGQGQQGQSGQGQPGQQAQGQPAQGQNGQGQQGQGQPGQQAQGQQGQGQPGRGQQGQGQNGQRQQGRGQKGQPRNGQGQQGQPGQGEQGQPGQQGQGQPGKEAQGQPGQGQQGQGQPGKGQPGKGQQGLDNANHQRGPNGSN